jgi:GxxExxY protein
MPYDDEDPPFVEPDPELDALAKVVIGAAIEVHKHYGPGLDEDIYQRAMEIELNLRGVRFVRQAFVEIEYKGQPVGTRRVDLIVGGRLIVELKAVESLSALHKAQVLTYLRITSMKLGLLINFNTILLKDGIKRVIHHPK